MGRYYCLSDQPELPCPPKAFGTSSSTVSFPISWYLIFSAVDTRSLVTEECEELLAYDMRYFIQSYDIP